MSHLREALRGLTLRGRAFLAAGFTAIVCALVLGQPALARVGLLVVALPLVTAAVVARSRYRLALVRTVSPQLVTAGQPATVTLALTNDGRAPSGALLLEDQVPYVLGTRPRFVLEGIGHGWSRSVGYQVRSDVRGRFELGPMTVRVNDPFGLVELGRAFRTVAPLVVTPRTVPLAPIPLGGVWQGSGDNRPRSSAAGSAEDVTVRDYRRGDDLRRVHWRSSARTGELMVRREEQPWESRATVYLDTRANAHRGHGIASSFETAVTAAASIALHLGERGFSVRLVTGAGEHPASAWVSRAASRRTTTSSAALLEALAVIEPVVLWRLDSSWLGDGGQGGLVVAVLGSLESADLPVVRRMQTQSSSALALALDVEAWTTHQPGEPDEPGDQSARADHRQPRARRRATPEHNDVTGVLVRQGWRAVALRPRDRLEQVWPELGRSGARAAAVAAPPAPAPPAPVQSSSVQSSSVQSSSVPPASAGAIR